MAAHRVSLWLPIVLAGIMAWGSASAQTQVLGPISKRSTGCLLGWLVCQRNPLQWPLL